MSGPYRMGKYNLGSQELFPDNVKADSTTLRSCRRHNGNLKKIPARARQPLSLDRRIASHADRSWNSVGRELYVGGVTSFRRYETCFPLTLLQRFQNLPGPFQRAYGLFIACGPPMI